MNVGQFESRSVSSLCSLLGYSRQAFYRFRRDAEKEAFEVEYLVEKSNYIGTNINRLKEKDDSISKLNEFRSLLINVREMVHITNSVNLAPAHALTLAFMPRT